MLMSAMVVAAAASIGQVAYLGESNPDRGLLATPAPYPAGWVDDVRRPGFNGRLWEGRPVIGGMPSVIPCDSGSPGPLAYGGGACRHELAYVRVGHLTVAIDPFERLNDEGLKRLERARQAWLRERGYTGGVRTFVNDVYAYGPAPSAQTSNIVPRATIELPADMPRIRPGRQQVDATTRFSMPPSTPKAVIARVQARFAPKTEVAFKD